ncbi:hypothetical protein A3K86_02160 [Photobacterium jeanii]|uniref:Lipoprotein n=1 Tax=Photobacterium jeanii TaxID=858640 RepID=A0A178KKU4_9GAMM|nr:hypothetical protein [Photobacterium jeanii]OAN17746.1 hypothetical protein A3K86_02160 [Photobacterium jeanii]PST92592.1 hypothetical protein C9I91_05315 [Photobacterium jeanii]
MFRTALITALPIFIIGCGGSGDDSSEAAAIGNVVDTVAKTRQADLHFVNTTGDAIDYHIRHTLSEDTLFASTNKVTSNLDTQITPYMYRWNISDTVTVQIGIQDTNTQSITSEIESLLIKENDDRWVIAWLDEGKTEQYKVSSVTRNQSSEAGKYRVRVFSQADAQIITTASISFTDAKQGVVTPYLTVENCNGDLHFGAESIDICQLDIGKSYLLITNGEDLLMAAEE